MSAHLRYETENEVRTVSAGATASWQYDVEIPRGRWTLTPKTIDHRVTTHAAAYYYEARVPGIIRRVRGMSDRGEVGSAYEIRVTLYAYEVRQKLARIDSDVSFLFNARARHRSTVDVVLSREARESTGIGRLTLSDAYEGRNFAAALAHAWESLPSLADDLGVDPLDLRVEVTPLDSEEG